MRSPIVFCVVALGVACGTSNSPDNTPESSSDAGGSSSGAPTTGGSSGTQSASGAPGSGSNSSGAGSTSGSSDAGGDDGESEASAEAAGSGASSGADGEAGGDDGSVPVDTGDGGATCLGTLYSAGYKCVPGMPAGTPCVMFTGGAAPGPCTATATLPWLPKCTTCPPDGQACCPAPPGQEPGWDVGELLRNENGSVTFTNVYAPADGDYDIVWYYHCGNADTDGYSSPTCPGAKEGSATGNPGCREAAFTVNGVDDPALYEFPCFLKTAPGSGWPIIHSWIRTKNVSSTVRVPFHLHQGNTNSIKIYARGYDTVDLSAIRVPDGRSGPF